MNEQQIRDAGIFATASTGGTTNPPRMHNFCPECGQKRDPAWLYCPTDATSLYSFQGYGYFDPPLVRITTL